MNCPLISIIVPVYQVEKYLVKCINSIINQTYRNLEIILVDDGSTDNCPAICDLFQTEDSRIKVIHQENGGLSHARNVGLEIATGDFIGFVDSDDWIEPNMYEVLMCALQESGADIAACTRQDEYEDSMPISINVKTVKSNIYSAEEALREIINRKRIIYTYVWNKLYKRDVLKNIYFPKGKMYEDMLWSFQAIGNARLLVCLNYPLYHYLQRPESISHKKELAFNGELDKFEMIKQRTEYICMHYPKLKKLYLLNFLNYCCRGYINISITHYQLDIGGKIQHELHHQFCQYTLRNLLQYDHFKTTVGRILFRFCPILLVQLYTINKKIENLISKNFKIKIIPIKHI